MLCQVSASRSKVVIPTFSYINFVPSLSMCWSVCPLSITFLVIVSAPKPLDVATLNVVDAYITRFWGYWQGCNIPLACSQLQVKCYAGRVKVLTVWVVFFQYYIISEKNLGHDGQVTYLEILHPCNTGGCFVWPWGQGQRSNNVFSCKGIFF